MKLRWLMTRANGDRLFVYGSFVSLFAGLMAIKTVVIVDSTAQWYMIAWGCFMLAVVLAGTRLTQRPTKSP